jgi:MinD superfamily P-loop ATPase
VESCHEGALQLIDGKARIINETFCDGLGACIGECPLGAIKLEEKEAEPYNEYAVMEKLSAKGEKTIKAHLLHLKKHNEMEYFKQGMQYLKEHGEPILKSV